MRSCVLSNKKALKHSTYIDKKASALLRRWAKKSYLSDEHFIFIFIKDTIICHSVDSSFFVGDKCLLLSWDTPANEFAYQQTYTLSLADYSLQLFRIQNHRNFVPMIEENVGFQQTLTPTNKNDSKVQSFISWSVFLMYMCICFLSNTKTLFSVWLIL